MEYIDLIGKPFMPGGRGPHGAVISDPSVIPAKAGIQSAVNRTDNGYDCYGLVKEIYARLGIALPEYGYDSPDNFSLIHQLIHGGKDLFEPLEKPEPFCVVLFTIRPPYISHIGVVLENCNSFIHIMEKVCVAVEKLDHPIWSRRIRGFLKWKN